MMEVAVTETEGRTVISGLGGLAGPFGPEGSMVFLDQKRRRVDELDLEVGVGSLGETTLATNVSLGWAGPAVQACQDQCVFWLGTVVGLATIRQFKFSRTWSGLRSRVFYFCVKPL